MGTIMDDSAVCDDLVNLRHVDHHAVQRNLQVRFQQHHIYTSVGPVLVSINPLQSLPLYTPEVLDRYSKQEPNLGPHLFLMADRAYHQLLSTGRPQSLITCGESGSGKTEATKLMLIYLMEKSRRRGEVLAAAHTPRELLPESLEEKTVCAQLVLEAFGNARTSRNDNSSRFAKWTEVSFSEQGRVTMARVHTFFLQTSRVAQVEPGERNFHIFYELLDYADDNPSFKETYALGPCESFQYLSRSGCTGRDDGIADVEEFERVLDAMDMFHFSDMEKDGVWRALSAILHIGNIEFTSSGAESVAHDDGGCALKNPENLALVAELLRVPKDHLERALLFRRFASNTNTPCRSSLNPMMQDMYVAYKMPEAVRARDALARTLYSRLFEHLNQRINACLVPYPEMRKGSRTISLLDASGFESFESNGFEQLCINYCNERLHTFFNENVFHSKMAEYHSEGIEMEGVACNDNSAVLEVLERRATGVFAMVNDEIRTPSGSPDNLLHKLRLAYQQNAHLTSEPLRPSQKEEGRFQLNHYAGCVNYEAAGMLEKSRSVLHPDMELVLATSTHPLMTKLFPPVVDADISASTNHSAPQSPPIPPSPSGPRATPTLAAQCCAQVAALGQKLRSTDPHFVQCLRPNTSKQSGLIKGETLQAQLDAIGMLALCRLHRDGYGIRMRHDAFVQRYWSVSRGRGATRVQELVAALTDDGILRPGLFNIGKQVVFLKQVQHKWLEAALQNAQVDAVLVVQRHARRWCTQRWFERVRAMRAGLERATAARDEEAMRAAIRYARATLPYQGRHLPEQRHALEVLERMPLEAKMEKLVLQAIEAGDVHHLREVAASCKDLQYASAAVDYAHTFLRMVELQSELARVVASKETYEEQVVVLNDRLDTSEDGRQKALAELEATRREVKGELSEVTKLLSVAESRAGDAENLSTDLSQQVAQLDGALHANLAAHSGEVQRIKAQCMHNEDMLRTWEATLHLREIALQNALEKGQLQIKALQEQKLSIEAQADSKSTTTTTATFAKQHQDSPSPVLAREDDGDTLTHDSAHSGKENYTESSALATEASSLKKANARAHRAPPLLDRVNGQDPTLCNQDQLQTLLPGSDSVAASAPSATEALEEDAAPSGRAELAAEVASSVAEVASSVAEVASSVADVAREESASVTSPEDDADRELVVNTAGDVKLEYSLSSARTRSHTIQPRREPMVLSVLRYAASSAMGALVWHLTHKKESHPSFKNTQRTVQASGAGTRQGLLPPVETMRKNNIDCSIEPRGPWSTVCTIEWTPSQEASESHQPLEAEA